MNQFNCIGNLGKDIELIYTTNGFAIASGSIAVKRGYHKEGEQDTDWLNFKALGKTAENMAKFFKKGSSLGITGSVHNDKYVKDGENKYFEHILVSNFYFVERKKKEETNGNNADNMEFQAIEDSDDIPFGG